MHPTVRIVATLSLLALGACQSPEVVEAPSRPVILVAQNPMVLELTQVDPRGRVGEDEGPAAAQFLDAYREGGRGPLAITVVGLEGTAIERAAAWVRDLARRRGVPPASIEFAAAEGPAPAMRLAYMDFVAIPPECAAEHVTSKDFANTPSPSFGCAMEHNIAVMVANPADLISPRGAGARDAVRTSAVLQAYRVGQPTGATRSSAEAANVSGIGGQ